MSEEREIPEWAIDVAIAGKKYPWMVRRVKWLIW